MEWRVGSTILNVDRVLNRKQRKMCETMTDAIEHRITDENWIDMWFYAFFPEDKGE